MARKTKQKAEETRLHIIDVAIRLFSQHGVAATSLADIALAAGVTRGAIYWYFKNKLDLFNEMWQLSKDSICSLEAQLRLKYPHDPLAVLREMLICVLEMGVQYERRRLMLEIIYHKCEYVGEMAGIYQAHRDLCLEDYERIEQTLEHCVRAGLLPGTLKLRQAAILMRAYISGLIENWLLAPASIDLENDSRSYINILLEIYQYCPTLHHHAADNIGGDPSPMIRRHDSGE